MDSNSPDTSNPTRLELEKRIIHLEKQLKVLNEMIDTIPNPLFVKDENFRYSNCNLAFADYLGLTKEEIINSSVYDISPKELADIYFVADTETKSELRNQLYETKVRYADGSLHDILFHKAPLLDENNQFRGIVGIMLDITERKRNEQIIHTYAEELQELNATKDKFFSIIAHELRNPFNAILGFSELLAESVDQLKPDNIRKFSDSILKSAKDTYRMLENLLLWANAQSGRITFKPKQIDISSFVQEQIEMFQPIAKHKDISISFCPSEEYQLFADTNMLKSILQNLLTNAIKFTHSGGCIDLRFISSNGYLEFIVEDNGIGISTEQIPKIFKLDTKQSSIGTAKEHGSGLGLILCKEFVEKHGGEIWVESRQAHGSQFHFTLPLSNEL